MREQTKRLVYCSLFTALMVVGAILKIVLPIGPFEVTVSLQIFFALIAGILLGAGAGFFSVLAYVILGLVGLPVFAHGGGLMYAMKPTFGFIIGFIAAAALSGLVYGVLRKTGVLGILAASLAGEMAYYGCGLLYYYVMFNYVLLSDGVSQSIGVAELFEVWFFSTVIPDTIIAVMAGLLAWRLDKILRLLGLHLHERTSHSRKSRALVPEEAPGSRMGGAFAGEWAGRKVIIATRGSALALAQTRIVEAYLKELGVQTGIRIVKTKGDRDQTSSLQSIGGNGLFVRTIEECLQNGEADIAVHSAKDFPLIPATGLSIGAILNPADPRDCLLTCKKTSEEEKANPVYGTGSARRVQACKTAYPKAVCKEIRGNIDTRIAKLRRGEYDGIFLAKAGLDRLAPDLEGIDVTVLDPKEFVPSPGQGLLLVERRADDAQIEALLQAIADSEAWRRFSLEHLVMQKLRADCSTPIGIHVEREDENLRVYTLFHEIRRELFFPGAAELRQLNELAESIAVQMQQEA